MAVLSKAVKCIINELLQIIIIYNCFYFKYDNLQATIFKTLNLL